MAISGIPFRSRSSMACARRSALIRVASGRISGLPFLMTSRFPPRSGSETATWCCQSNRNSSPIDAALALPRQASGHEGLPLGQGGRAAGLVGLSVDEVAFEVEVVVDVGMDRGELL